MKTGILIFSGYNPRAIIAFVRALDNMNISFMIIAKDQNDEILNTKYKENVIAIRKDASLNLAFFESYFEMALSFGEYDQLLIAPTTESLIRFLLPYKSSLSERNIILPVVDSQIYEIVSDKYSFGALCEKQGLTVPREININQQNSFPIVAKPINYKEGQLRPVIIQNEIELAQFNHSLDNKKYYLQEYIAGRSIYLLYYFDRFGRVMKYSQENLLQQPNGKSMLASVGANFHNENISKDYENLFANLGFRGLVMVEVKLFNDKYYMIEANPRMWGPSQLFVDAGENLFEAFMMDYGIMPEKDITKGTKKSYVPKYFWLDGLINTLEEGTPLTNYNNGIDELFSNLSEWFEADIYNRSDTVGIKQRKKEKLL